MKAAFGMDTDLQMNPDESFVEKAKKAPRLPLYIRAFSLFPFHSYLSRYVNAFPNTEFFVDLAKNMLQQKAQQGGSGRRDLLQLMLEAHEVTVDGVSKLNDDELVTQSIAFLFAGLETTSSTLTSIAFFLVAHPEVQDKLIEEIDKADKARGDTPMYDYVKKIGYLDQVICEVLRLCPTVYNLIRGCEEDAVYKSIRFPKGVVINIPVYVLHRNPELWDNPLEFNPENFSPEAKEKRDPYFYLPFGNGPRQCIGMRFALLKIKMALLKIMQKFKFERAPETVAKLEHQATLLMSPRDTIYVKIKAR